MTSTTTAQTSPAVQPLSGTVATRSERAAAQVARRTQMDARKAAVFARATTEVLFGAVAALEAKHDAGTPLDEAEQMTRGWILGEIERRHPEVDPLMDAWANSDADPRTYSRALLAAVAATTPAAPAQVSAAKPRRDLTAEIAERRAAALEAVRSRRALAERYPGRVHLQGIGMCPAVPAGDLRVGDVLAYNQGETAVVLELRPKGRATVVIVTGDKPWQQRDTRRTTLIAISARPGDDA